MRLAEIVQGLHHRQQGIRCRHPAAVSEPHRGILVLLLPFISAGPGFTVDVAIRHIAASNKVTECLGPNVGRCANSA